MHCFWLGFVCFLLPCYAKFVYGILHEDINFAYDSSKILQSKLTNFADDILGISKLEQIYFSNVTEKKEIFNTKKNLKRIGEIIGLRLQNAVDVLHKNKKYIEQKYKHKKLYNYTDFCCELKSSSSDDHDKLTEICHSNIDHQTGIKIPRDSNLFFYSNLSPLDGIIWQYFGDSDGNYFQYPGASKFCERNKTLDHRFQNWYVYTASPQKKNVVVIIDESGSMVWPVGGMKQPHTPTREDVAKEAANSVLNTLSSTDHVGMVAFSYNARSPSGCLGTKMAKASDENKVLLRNFISTINRKNTTCYSKAFDEAFKLFNASKQQNPEQFENSLDMILFLTDGVPTDDKKELIFEEIATGQTWMGNKVYIFVYGLGKELLAKTSISDNIKILQQIADQNNGILNGKLRTAGNFLLQWPVSTGFPNNTQPVGPAGNITLISDADGHLLKEIMGKYYTRFPMSQHSSVTVSLPHTDGLTGQVITLGLPTIDTNGKFFGVAAVDVSLEIMFYEVVHFKKGQFSYAFLVGGKGKVLSHPFMSSLPSDKNGQTRIYNISQLEPSLSTDALRNISMGIEGEEAATAVVWKDHGSRKQVREAIYYYRPVQGFESNYTIVFVIFKEDLYEIVKEKADIASSDIEVTINTQNITEIDDKDICIVSNTVLQDKSSTGTFMFSRDIARHLTCDSLGSKQNCTFQQVIGNGQTLLNSSFTDDNTTIERASFDIFLTEAVSQNWSHPTDILRRYIGTESGVFRISPSIIVTDTVYDPREEFWYNEAFRNPESYMFTADSIIGQEDVISITSTYKTNSGSVDGVIGLEISGHHLQMFIMNVLEDCVSRNKHDCYIIDDRGYILHRLKRFSSTVKQHLIEVLPQFSKYLIHRGSMMLDWCMDLNTGDRHLSYRLTTDGQTVQYNSTDICTDFVLSPVNNTNLYLLVSSDMTACTSSKTSAVQNNCPCTDNCTNCDVKQRFCQCPCKCNVKSGDVCSPDFDLTSGYRPCSGLKNNFRRLKLLLNKSFLSQQQNVSRCQQPCPFYLNKKQCEMRKCEWCENGYYKKFPVCTHHCIKDRLEVQLFSPCINLTDIDVTDQDALIYNLRSRVISLLSAEKSIIVSQPQIVSDDSIKLVIETKDESSVPDEVLGQLWAPINLSLNSSNQNISITLLKTDHTDFSDFQVVLHLSGINFTEKLQNALTLRAYVHKMIKILALDTFSRKVASSVSDIWLEDNTISFWIKKKFSWKSVRLEDEVNHLLKVQENQPLQFDLLGDNVTVYNISTRGSFNGHCPAVCQELNDSESCNMVPHCHWNVEDRNCSNNPFLPERKKLRIYFPCLGLYKSFNGTENLQTEEVVSDFKLKMKDLIPILSDKALIHIELIQRKHIIGSIIELVIQGTALDPPISETVWTLKQSLTWSSNFSISLTYQNNSVFRSDVVRRSYEQFTNMHIFLEINSLEDFMVEHPLTGRKEIKNALHQIARSHFVPEVAKSVNNLLINKNTIQFTISKTPLSSIDLRLEYERLKMSVDNMDVKMILFRKEFDINTSGTYFQGTYDNICPRNCKDRLTENVCSGIPGCIWTSRDNLCTDQFVLSERKPIEVVFPCAEINNLNTSTRNKILSTVEHQIRRRFTNLSHTDLHSFQFGKRYLDSVQFILEGRKLSSLIQKYEEIMNWIKNGNLKLTVNGLSIDGKGTGYFNSFNVYLEYEKLKFGSEDESAHMHKVKRQLNDLLEPDIIFDTGYFIKDKTQMILVLSAQKETNTTNIEEIIERIRKLIDIGGLCIISSNKKFLPTSLQYKENLNFTCSHNCENIYNETECRRSSGCYWGNIRNITKCTNDSYINNWLTIDLDIPCNSTKNLNITEMKETEDDLHYKVTQILHPVSSKVVKNISITKNGVNVVLQATSTYPYLHNYANIITMATIRFGPVAGRQTFVVLQHGDYTDLEITLQFNSIDFGAIQNSLLADKQHIIKSLHRKLNSILLGETMLYFDVLLLEKDSITFELKKEKDGLINMVEQMKILQEEVTHKNFVLDISYIRPVLATSVKIEGSFKSLCPDKYPPSTTMKSPSTENTSSSLPKYQTTSVSSTSVNMPSVILVYNSSELSEMDLWYYMDVTAYWDVCFVPIKDCPFCVRDFYWPKCRFQKYLSSHPYGKDTTTKHHSGKGLNSSNRNMESPGHSGIGPGEASGITLAAVLAVLLAVGAATLAYKMKKKADLNKSKTSNGRGIEETQ